MQLLLPHLYHLPPRQRRSKQILIHAGRELPDLRLGQFGKAKQEPRSSYYIFLSHKYKLYCLILLPVFRLFRQRYHFSHEAVQDTVGNHR